MDTASFQPVSNPSTIQDQMGSKAFVNSEQIGSNSIAMHEQGHSKGIANAKQGRRKALPTPMQIHSETLEPLQLRCYVTGGATAINDKRFPQYSMFVLNPKSSDIYIKVSKSECISLSSKQRYSTNIQGYPVTLV